MSTPYLLQDALIDEIKALFVGFETENARGEPAPLNVYPQRLPDKQEEDDSEHFPYIIVRVMDGGTAGEDEAATCKIGLIVGVYDESSDQQGHRTVLNILRRIETHFFTKRFVDRKYQIVYPYDWTLYEDDTAPFYFGGAETNWLLPAVRQEVDLFGD
mgnify:CR=1 FL=1|jgi:hypothetical protein